MRPRLLREPLLHFLVLGGAIFGAFALVSNGDEASPDDGIVVTPGKIEHLATIFARTWQRPPTRGELEGLVREHVREEAAVRQALSMGLEDDDPVVRRRLRQKLEFLAADLGAQRDPTEEDLAAYLEARAEDFRIDPRLSFRQVYFDPDTRGASLEEDVRAVLARLGAGADPGDLGDRTLLEPAYDEASPADIAAHFGEDFAARLASLEPGAWTGPLASAYGVHVVVVDHVGGGRVPTLDEVRSLVRLEWEAAERQRLIDEFYERLVRAYDVRVEWPGAVTGGDGP